MRSALARFNRKNLVRIGLYSILMSPLFFYYWIDYKVPDYVVMILFVVWIISIVLDMGITIQHRHLIIKHESNLVFRNLYNRYNTITAIIIQLSVEISFVLLMPFLFHKTQYTLDLQSSSIIAGIVSVLHLTAWYSNKKITKISHHNDANQ